MTFSRVVHKLDGRYASFGYMLEGFDVLDAIADEPTHGPETWNKPLNAPVIRSIRVTSDAELPPVVRLP